MKVRVLYWIIVLLALKLNAQEINLHLKNGGIINFSSHFYSFGINNNGFTVYKLTPQLKIVDSAIYIANKNVVDNIYKINADTLHNCLHFYLLKKENKNGALLKFDKELNLLKVFADVDATRLSPLADFNYQKVFYENNCFVVKTAFDSTGVLYYLSKYEIDTTKKEPNAYKFLWQFNFEKKHIGSSHLFHADSTTIYVYVDIVEGERKGQWLLKINSKNGLLIKGKKINNKSALNYHFSNYCIDNLNKELVITGIISSTATIASATPTVFISSFDTLLNPVNDIELPIKTIPANPKAKTVNPYLLQISKTKVMAEGTVNMEVDFYKALNNQYTYSNTHIIEYNFNNTDIILPFQVKENTDIDNFYFTNDKNDINGKLLLDTNYSSNRLFYNPPLIKAKLFYKINDAGFPCWLLKKTNFKDKNYLYGKLQPGKKVYEWVKENPFKLEEEPSVFLINNSSYLLFKKVGEEKVNLKIQNW